MATTTEIQQQIDRAQRVLQNITIQAQLLENEVNRGAVFGDPDFVGNRIANLNTQINAAIDLLNNAADQIPTSDASPTLQSALLDQIDTIGNALLDQQSKLNGISFQAERNGQQQALSQQQAGNSAGDIVDNEKNAQQADAKVQSPQQGRLTLDEDENVIAQPSNTDSGSNARAPTTSDDASSNTTTRSADANTLSQTGTNNQVDQGITQSGSPFGNDATGGAISTVGGDAETLPASQTQRGTKSTSSSGSSNNTSSTSGVDRSTPDVALDDDAISPTQSSTATSVGSGDRPEIAKEFIEPIISRANILSGVSSMTYGLSWYLMNPEEFADFVIAEEKVLPSSQLLVQSAGAPTEQRNEWFNVDFYIENFTLDSVVGTQAVGSPHNAVTLEFDVVEPQGITLLNRLNNAVIDHIGEDVGASQTRADGLAQSYLMVIRFYGYDASGNLVTASDLGLPSTSDANAIQEKFIPFVITGFGYKIASKATEYKISGACTGTNIAFSTARGVIPFNIQLTASTIDQLFNGNKVLDDSQDGDTESDSNQTGTTQTVVQGLTQALNDHQQRMAGESAEIPDEYEIVFQDPALRNAKIVKPGKVSKTKASNLTAEQAARKYLTSKLNYDKESQTYNVLAGTQIVQLIDLLLRSSTYVTSQQDIYIDEKTGKPVGPNDPNGVPRSVPTVQWFRVKTQVVPLGYDNKRRTVAYKITYLVNKYQINSPRSAYFPNSEYRGVHKLYNYWFTGQNTEVLDFEINVDKNFFMVIGNDGRVDDRDPGMFGGAQIYSSAPGQSLQGGERGSTVPAANLSDRLYSFADVATAELDIVGDPDWIQQNEIVYNRSLTLEPFAPDGSVNFDASEVLFELRFNPVQDYDLETGLSNVYENNRDITIQAPNGDITQPNAAQESIIWCATTVTSMFREGSFTQRLQGVYRPLESSKNAPINPQAQVVLSDGNTVEQALAERERDTTTVGGEETGAGGAGNKDRANAQRNLDRNSPSSAVTTKRIGGKSAAAEDRGVVVEIVPNDQFPDDDAGTASTRTIGGRSSAARRR